MTLWPGRLLRVHDGIGCNDCHVDNTRELANDKCLGCHDHRKLRLRIIADQGFHAGATVRRSACASCHHEHRGLDADLRGWDALAGREQIYNHRAETGVEIGAHKNVSCFACHPQRYTRARTCVDCHTGAQPPGRAVSRHGSRFAKLDCRTCHSSTSWNAHFDHGKTKFPLDWWVHDKVACRACHRGSNPADFEDLARMTACRDCHAHRTVHEGKYTSRQCLLCHLRPGDHATSSALSISTLDGPM